MSVVSHLPKYNVKTQIIKREFYFFKGRGIYFKIFSSSEAGSGDVFDNSDNIQLS